MNFPVARKEGKKNDHNIRNWVSLLKSITLVLSVLQTTLGSEVDMSTRLAPNRMNSVLGLVIVCLCTATISAEPKPRVDSLGDPLPQGALLRFGTKRFQHPSGPSKILLSKDEKIVFSINEDFLIAWDAESGKQLWREPFEHQQGIRVGAAGYGVNTLAVTPDGKLVSPAGPGRVFLWRPTRNKDSANYEVLKVGIVSPAKSIDVSPDGKLLAVGTNRVLIVCDRSGTEKYEIANPNQLLKNHIDGDRMTFGGDFSYGKFSPDGKILAVVHSSKPNTIQLFQATTGEAIGEIEGKNRIVRFAFSPDSRQIAATERDISARLYDVATRKQVWEYVIVPDRGGESYTSDIAFRPDSKQIAVGAPIGNDYRIRLLDAKTGKETGSLSGSGWKPWTLQYKSDSSVLYGSGWDGVIRRWDLATNEMIPLAKGVRAEATCAMSRDGELAAFTDDLKNIHLVAVATGETIKQFAEPGVGWGQVIFSHNGTMLAAGGDSDKKVHTLVWDIESGKKLHHWDWEKGKDTHSGVEALAFSKNGKRLGVAVFRQDAAYVFDLPNDLRLAKIPHKDVYGLDIDAEGATLFTAGWDKHIRVWDAVGGKELQSLKVEAPPGEGDQLQWFDKDTRMYGIKLSNDESMLATVDMTRSIRFFDRELRSISRIRTKGSFTFGTLQFSRNDLWFGIGTGRLQIFDIASGTELWSPPREHEEYVYNVDFGARDTSFLSGGTDGVCYLWDLHPADDPRKLSVETIKQLCDDLVDWNCVKAFKAYQTMARPLKNDDAGVAVGELHERVARMLEQKDVSKVVNKWIVALGAQDQAIVNQALQRLTAMGPEAYDEVNRALDAESLTEEKRKRLEEVRDSLFRPLRWSIALLGSIDSPNADDALADLMKLAKTKQAQQLIQSAIDRRANYAK